MKNGLPHRLDSYYKQNDLSITEFTAQLNDFFSSQGWKRLSRGTLYNAMKERGQLTERTIFKLQSFLDAKAGRLR